MPNKYMQFTPNGRRLYTLSSLGGNCFLFYVCIQKGEYLVLVVVSEFTLDLCDDRNKLETQFKNKFVKFLNKT